MTTEEAREFQDEWMASRPKWGDQDENGVDVARIRANLALTPDERVRKHDRALKLAMEMRSGAHDAGLRRDPQRRFEVQLALASLLAMSRTIAAWTQAADVRARSS